MANDRPREGVEYKSEAVKKLDAFFGDQAKRAANRGFARGILRDRALPTLAAVTEKVKRKMSLPDDQSTHFRDHWFNVGGNQVEQEMRRGYEEAMERAEAQNLPIETFWVWGSEVPKYEIRVLPEQQRIKVLVRIPKQLFEAAYGAQ
jgi:hypothetical protein